MSSLRPRLVLALSLLAASTAASLAACVGDEPATIAAAPGDDAATTPTPGQDASPGADTGTADAADAGQDAAPKRFCQTQAPLTGVTDFFCADFDGT
ncbi:MAG TPA: hypothetical protein VLT33_40900, partial [Labilithrix sp.]|nr:hypothetical protein [Labilithrix sp.]